MVSTWNPCVERGSSPFNSDWDKGERELLHHIDNSTSTLEAQTPLVNLELYPLA